MFLHAIIPKVASQWMDKTMTPNTYSTGARGEYVCPVMDQHGIALALYPKPPWCEKTVKESMLVGWWPIVYNSVQQRTTMYNDDGPLCTTLIGQNLGLTWDPAQKYLTASSCTSELFQVCLWCIDDNYRFRLSQVQLTRYNSSSQFLVIVLVTIRRHKSSS